MEQNFYYMKIIIGLGNPGSKYENTRHNAWFLAVNFLQKFWNLPEWQDSKFGALISEINMHWEKIILMKPLTFMNLSGNSVSKIVNFYKTPIQDILVISDDIDMDFGKVRFREKWSHGWQNGLKHIMEKIGTSEFSRLKIGIGRHERMSVSDWVLSKFQAQEMEFFEKEIFSKITEYCENFIQKK